MKPTTSLSYSLSIDPDHLHSLAAPNYRRIILPNFAFASYSSVSITLSSKRGSDIFFYLKRVFCQHVSDNTKKPIVLRLLGAHGCVGLGGVEGHE